MHEENGENCISLRKINKNLYDIYIHNECIHLKQKSVIIKYQYISMICRIKWKTFGSKFKVYKGNDKNHPIMLRNCKQIYLPPKCVQHNGINTFKTTEISRLEKYQYLTIYNDCVYLDDEVILAKFTNELSDTNFLFKSKLTIMQAVCIIFFLI